MFHASRILLTLAALIALFVVVGTATAAEVTNPQPGQFVRGPLAVTWTKDVANGEISLKFFTSGTEIRPDICDPCTGTSRTIQTTLYGDGSEYIFEIRENNQFNNGNNNRRTMLGTFTIDNTPPTTKPTLSGATGASGYFVGDVTVELSGADATAGVASTLYRVDGGALTAYAGSFRVTGAGAHTVQFHSVDRAGNVETTRSVSFNVDATAPATISAFVGSAGGAGYFTGPVSVTLSATDATSGVAATYASVDDGPFALTGGALAVAGDGGHVVRYHSVDAAGNAEPLDSVAFAIDATAPRTTAVAFAATGAGGYYVGDVEIALSATDATSGVASTSYRVDGGAWETYTSSFRVTGDGAHTVEFASVDAAGNAETTRSISFDVDASAPATGAALAGALGAAGWYVGDVTVTLSPSDATSGAAAMRVSVDDAPWTDYAGAFAVTGDGEHGVRYYAVDGAGNAEPTQSIAFRIDATVPDATASLHGATGLAGYYTGDVTVGLAAADATSGVAGVSVRVDGGAFVAFADTFRVAGDGAHTVEFYATDVAGNVEPVESVVFTIDGTVPETASALAGPLGLAGWYVGPVTTHLGPADATSGVAATLSSADAQPWAGAGLAIVTSADGAHVVRYHSVDAAGLSEPVESVSFRIDATAPESEATLLGRTGAHGWYTGDVTFWISSVDATSGVDATAFTIDGAGPQKFVGSVRVAGEGDHVLTFQATDVAGNLEDLRTVVFQIDTVAPASALAIGAPSVDEGRVTYIRSDTPLTLSATDATSGVDRIEYKLNGGAFVPYTGAFTVAGEDGEYRLEWRAVDFAGNVEDAQFFRLFLDNTAPALALEHPEPNGLYVNEQFIVETHPAHVMLDELDVTHDAITLDRLPFATAIGDLRVEALTADASVGVAEVRFFVDGILRATDASAPYEWLWETGFEVLGEHSLVVESEDRLGTVASTQIYVIVLPSTLEGWLRTWEEGPALPPSYVQDKIPDVPALPDVPEAPVDVPAAPDLPVAVPDAPALPEAPESPVPLPDAPQTPVPLPSAPPAWVLP